MCDPLQKQASALLRLATAIVLPHGGTGIIADATLVARVQRVLGSSRSVNL